MAVAEKRDLQPVLGWGPLLPLAIGTFLGSPWVMMTGPMVSAAGPVGAFISQILAAVICTIVALAYGQMGNLIRRAGAELSYAYRAFGVVAAFFVGWLVVGTYITPLGLESMTIPWFFGFFNDTINDSAIYRMLIGLVIGAIFVFVNWRGIKVAATVQLFLAATLVIAGVATWVLMIPSIDPALLANGMPYGWGPVLTQTLMMSVFQLFGFTIIMNVIEETRRENVSPRTASLFMLSSIWMASAVVIGPLYLVIGGVVPYQDMAAANPPTFIAAAVAFGGKAAPLMIIPLIAGVFAICTSINGFLLGASRVLYAMGRGGVLPSFFTHLSRHRTPTISLLICYAVAVLSVIGHHWFNLTFWDISEIHVWNALAIFPFVTLSALVLYSKAPWIKWPWVAPGGRAMLALSVIVSLYILVAHTVTLAPVAIWAVGLWILLGIVVFAFSIPKFRSTPKETFDRGVLGEDYLAREAADREEYEAAGAQRLGREQA